ncbi:CBS domain-containing protein [Streptomyces luteolifulvus]|uniref:CBS domain-containing protein n=1 Tax=Streptomyces luteolifulvus TaxID=2615112 RepID=UPI002EDB50AE
MCAVVAHLLHQHRISGLPVVDAHERVVGVISETDLLAVRSRPTTPMVLPAASTGPASAPPHDSAGPRPELGPQGS